MTDDVNHIGYDEQIENATEILEREYHSAFTTVVSGAPDGDGVMDADISVGGDIEVLGKDDLPRCQMSMLAVHFEATASMMGVPPEKLAAFLVQQVQESDFDTEEIGIKEFE